MKKGGFGASCVDGPGSGRSAWGRREANIALSSERVAHQKGGVSLRRCNERGSDWGRNILCIGDRAECTSKRESGYNRSTLKVRIVTSVPDLTLAKFAFRIPLGDKQADSFYPLSQNIGRGRTPLCIQGVEIRTGIGALTRNPQEHHKNSTSGGTKGHILKSSCGEHL